MDAARGQGGGEYSYIGGRFNLKRNSAAWWDNHASEAVLALLDHEHAATTTEIEAKLAEARFTHSATGRTFETIDPHHLTTARNRLTSRKLIEPVTEPTRGGAQIPVYGLADRVAQRRQTAFDRAAARKRLLYTRYLSWTRASGNTPNLIGVGGERTTRASLLTAAGAGIGYRLEKPAGGDVDRLFGHAVPIGPLDNAAHLYVPTENYRDVPILIPVEVKNLRSWIYPQTVELYQLLWMGVMAPILFVVVFALDGAFQPGYSAFMVGLTRVAPYRAPGIRSCEPSDDRCRCTMRPSGGEGGSVPLPTSPAHSRCISTQVARSSSSVPSASTLPSLSTTM